MPERASYFPYPDLKHDILVSDLSEIRNDRPMDCGVLKKEATKPACGRT